MRYFKKLVGERVYLSPINVEDFEIYTKWLNDYEVSRNLGLHKSLISLNSEKKILETMTSEGHNFAIVLLENDTLLGNISFHKIDHIGRKTDIGLFIGEPENRGKGYGAEALRLLLDYGFRTLNLNNIMLLVHADNEQAIACYKKVGFKEFGRRRKATFSNGQYIDVVYMDILADEYYCAAASACK